MVALLPQLIAWKIIFGSFIVYPYVQGGFDPTSPKIIETLLSAKHGLISWTPIVFLSLLGLPYFYRKHKTLATIFGAGFLIQLYVVSSWQVWWLGARTGIERSSAAP